MTEVETMAAGAKVLMDAFKRGDEALVRSRILADDLRAARDVLKAGWSDLIQTGDHDEIARLSMRLAEIDRELARLGV